MFIVCLIDCCEISVVFCLFMFSHSVTSGSSDSHQWYHFSLSIIKNKPHIKFWNNLTQAWSVNFWPLKSRSSLHNSIPLKILSLHIVQQGYCTQWQMGQQRQQQNITNNKITLLTTTAAIHSFNPVTAVAMILSILHSLELFLWCNMRNKLTRKWTEIRKKRHLRPIFEPSTYTHKRSSTWSPVNYFCSGVS